MNALLDLEPIKNSDKVGQISEILKRYIIEGKMQPGEQLPSERDLALRLKVSRFSLREALRIMQAHGLILISRGQKPRVAQVSAGPAAEIIRLTLKRTKRTLIDVVHARKVIETQIAGIAATHASVRDIKEMEATIKRISEHRDDPEYCVQEDMKFHAILVRATGNPIFEIMLAPLSELLYETRKKTVFSGANRVIQNHRAVLEAIRRQDTELAAQAMCQHLEMAEEDLNKLLRRQKVHRVAKSRRLNDR